MNQNLPTQKSLGDKLQSVFFHPVVALVWLIVIVMSGLWVGQTIASGRTFDSSILALLPEEDQLQTTSEKIAKEHLAKTAKNTLVFLVGHPIEIISLEAASSFAKRLEQSSVFEKVKGKITDTETKAFKDFYEPYRYVLLSVKDREKLESFQMSQESPLLKDALAKLYSPMASLVGAALVEDPLQTFFNWQLSVTPKTSFSLQDGWLTRNADNMFYRLVSVDLSESPFNMAYQQAVENVIQKGRDELPVGSELLSSGMLFHAAYGARQAKSEVSTIGLGSLAGITLMLLYFFRSVRYVAVAFIPIVTGCVFSLGVCLFVFEELHLITLAFGAGLVGVAIDYSLHYLCASKDAQKLDFTSGKKCHAISKIFPGITLGLVSSTIAYAAQGMSPFPGLQQMAVFSVLGLFGAWMTVVCWLPRLPLPRHKDQSLSESTKFIRITTWMLDNWPNISKNKTRVFLIIVVLLSVYQITGLKFDDDIRKLQTSPQSMLDEEYQIQQLTQAVNVSQYFVISGDDEQQLLQREENLRKNLDRLLVEKKITDYHAVSKMVPSLQVQNKNISLIEKNVFSDIGLADIFSQKVGSDSLSKKTKEAFNKDRNNRLDIKTWSESSVGEFQQYLWVGEKGGQYYSVVTLAGIADKQALASLADSSQMDNGIQFVDTVSSITHVLESNRQSLLRWLMIAYIIVLLLLYSRYGYKVWRVVAVPAVASLVALAVLSAGGFVVNIFNLLALLLVLGIGLDASIFLRESRQSIHTWVAVTLAAITTLLAFGLLALSQTPVLHQFGITVLVGIIGVWLLAPCFTED